MVIVHSIIGQLCLRGRAWVGYSNTPRISVHNGARCVCKNWHCARVTRPLAARYRDAYRALLFPKNTTHPRTTLSLSLSLSLSLAITLSVSLFAFTRLRRHPCGCFPPLPSRCSTALRAHPSPDNVLSVHFFSLLSLSLSLSLFPSRQNRRCADRVFF